MTINNSLSAETTEEAESHEVLEFDDKLYSQLPGNVVELQLQHQKEILRQYVLRLIRRSNVEPKCGKTHSCVPLILPKSL